MPHPNEETIKQLEQDFSNEQKLLYFHTHRDELVIANSKYADKFDLISQEINTHKKRWRITQWWTELWNINDIWTKKNWVIWEASRRAKEKLTQYIQLAQQSSSLEKTDNNSSISPSIDYKFSTTESKQNDALHAVPFHNVASQVEVKASDLKDTAAKKRLLLIDIHTMDRSKFYVYLPSSIQIIVDKISQWANTVLSPSKKAVKNPRGLNVLQLKSIPEKKNVGLDEEKHVAQSGVNARKSSVKLEKDLIFKKKEDTQIATSQHELVPYNQLQTITPACLKDKKFLCQNIIFLCTYLDLDWDTATVDGIIAAFASRRDAVDPDKVRKHGYEMKTSHNEMYVLYSIAFANFQKLDPLIDYIKKNGIPSFTSLSEAEINEAYRLGLEDNAVWKVLVNFGTVAEGQYETRQQIEAFTKGGEEHEKAAAGSIKSLHLRLEAHEKSIAESKEAAEKRFRDDCKQRKDKAEAAENRVTIEIEAVINRSRADREASVKQAKDESEARVEAAVSRFKAATEATETRLKAREDRLYAELKLLAGQGQLNLPPQSNNNANLTVGHDSISTSSTSHPLKDLQVDAQSQGSNSAVSSTASSSSEDKSSLTLFSSKRPEPVNTIVIQATPEAEVTAPLLPKHE